MAVTFGFVGNRPDVGHLISRGVRPELLTSAASGRAVRLGTGWFQADEVLLRRRPVEGTEPLSLGAEWSQVRGHALLGHAETDADSALSTESTQPLRFGHLLFVCHGKCAPTPSYRQLADAHVPQFLRLSLGAYSPAEVAFGLFLSALPRHLLEQARRPGPSGPAPEQIARGLERALTQLAEGASKAGLEPFMGDLWVLTGESMVIAHQSAPLWIRVFHSRRDMEELAGAEASAPVGPDQAKFVAALCADVPLHHGWERLPQGTLLSAVRGGAPEVRALDPAPESARGA